MKPHLRTLSGATILTILVVAFAPASAQVVEADIGNEWACNSLTRVCTANTSGFHKGLVGMTGVSTFGPSTGVCFITISACLSKGPTFTTTMGSCFFATATTSLGPVVLAADAGLLCLPG